MQAPHAIAGRPSLLFSKVYDSQDELIVTDEPYQRQTDLTVDDFCRRVLSKSKTFPRLQLVHYLVDMTEY
jgi:hypothetical protein